jgi:hypothetical protein
MTDQLDLDAIEARAARLYERTATIDPNAHPDFGQLTDTDVPVLVAEIRRLRAQAAMVCALCETPVGWIDCPTGGWWAHDTHPTDGHDASPMPAAGEAHVVADDTLPAWLAQRFDPRGPGWEQLSGDDRDYWEHHAAAVRRAVARGGFKTEAGEGR